MFTIFSESCVDPSRKLIFSHGPPSMRQKHTSSLWKLDEQCFLSILVTKLPGFLLPFLKVILQPICVRITSSCTESLCAFALSWSRLKSTGRWVSKLERKQKCARWTTWSEPTIWSWSHFFLVLWPPGKLRPYNEEASQQKLWSDKAGNKPHERQRMSAIFPFKPTFLITV